MSNPPITSHLSRRNNKSTNYTIRNLSQKMVNSEDSDNSPSNMENPCTKDSETTENVSKNENLFSPRFRSVAAMAGWDEEALLIASLVVEDTPPHRQSTHKKRSVFQNLKTPPSNSRRKRKSQRRSPVATSVPIVALDLDETLDESTAKQDKEKIEVEEIVSAKVKKSVGDAEVNTEGSSGVSSTSTTIPCIDRLREELSCAICLEICYEPSTTPCGHSFCQKCLRSAADKCGKRCPKCRQLISNGRYCTVNTVLWNTIQLLFPQEVETRKAAAAAENHESKAQSPAKTRHHNTRNRLVQALNSPDSASTGQDRRNNRHRSRSSRPLSRRDVSTTRELPVQDEDAALALRLQREEFMEAFREPDRRNSLAVARANLRAMATRAMNIRIRDRRN